MRGVIDWLDSPAVLTARMGLQLLLSIVLAPVSVGFLIYGVAKSRVDYFALGVAFGAQHGVSQLMADRYGARLFLIGGASLMGGRGNMRGTMLGAFVIGFLSDGLVIIGISAYWQTVFTGAVIVLAVLLNAVQYRRRVKPSGQAGGQPTSQNGAKAGSANPANGKTAG